MSFLRVVGTIAILVGIVWIVQGFSVVPTGSFMDGQPVWGVIGIACVVGGIGAFAVDHRRRASGSR